MKGDAKISWVSWCIVCKSKRDDGLCVGDIQLVNLALFPNRGRDFFMVLQFGGIKLSQPGMLPPLSHPCVGE